MRLYAITGDSLWLEPVGVVIQFLKSTQNRTSRNLGLRGGIRGSLPTNGPYGSFEVLNWATKFFADALIRHERIVLGGHAACAADYALA